MEKRRLYLIASNILLIAILAACSSSTPSAAPGSTTVPATLAANTAAPSNTTAPTNTPAPTNTAAPAATSSTSGSGGCANAYYPVASGATWSYASTGSGIGNYTYTQTITTASDTGFTTSEQFSTGVNATVKWNCQAGNLAVLDAGANSFNMSTSKITLTSDSTTADGYNIPSSFASGKTWSEKVTTMGSVNSNGTKMGDSQITMQLSCTAAGTDTITVPAGKFDTVKATCTKSVVVSYTLQGTAVPLGSNQESITYWYAKGVGFVQSIATGGSDNETIVLTQYKLQ